jgi:hypothetical protein
MNAALKQICSCRWDHASDTRLTTDPQCAVHGEDTEAVRQRTRKQGELLALQEGLRDQRSDAMAALHLYRRTKRKFFALKDELKGDAL